MAMSVISGVVGLPGFQTLGLFQSLGWQELLIILVIGVILFGKRLPEVGRNVGKAIVEFKKGVKNVTDEIDREADRPEPRREPQRPAPKEIGEGVDATVSQEPARSKSES